MDPSSFWRGRRALVLGCTGFLGTHVVRALLERGALVTGLVRDSQRSSEFLAERFDRKITVVRGSADTLRIRSLIAVHEPAAVFQLAAVSGQSHVKHRITADFLRAVARLSPSLPVVVPVGPADRSVEFRSRTPERLRLGFVSLPTLFGEGSTADDWTARLFANAAQGRLIPPTERDEPLAHAAQAANVLLAAAEILTALAEPPVEEFRLNPSATTTARELQARVGRPYEFPEDSLAELVDRTLRWYERRAPRPELPPVRRAA